MIYQMNLAGLSVPIQLIAPDTCKVFVGFLEEAADIDIPEKERRDDGVHSTVLQPSEEVVYRYLHEYHVPYFRAEADALIPIVSDWLLPHGCIFHGAAFQWDGMAYLMTGPSGVGKSTQLMNWMKLYPDEIGIINGDKPAMRFDHDGNLRVYPSPWNGKENYRGNESAMLAGIICLKQGDKNKITISEKKEVIPFLFTEMFSSVENKEAVLKVSAFLERLLQEVKVWTFENTGSDESTRMMHDFLKDNKE